MANRELETATYVLKIVTPPNGDRSRVPTYTLEDQDSLLPREYASPAELVRSILETHDHLSDLDDNESSLSELKSQVLALQTLLMSGKSELDKLRFLMTDRITSAMTKMTLLKNKKEGLYSETEESWLNQGLSDLTRLSFAIEEWTRLCEIVDINQLENPAELTKMVTNITSFD